jgi:hypothetical protein
MKFTENQPEPHVGEPSVLDWVKSLLKGRPLPIPEVDAAEGQAPVRAPTPPSVEPAGPAFRVTVSHLRLPLALILALLAQLALEQRAGSPWGGVALYVIAGLLVGWAVWQGDLPRDEQVAEPGNVSGAYRPPYLVAAGILSLLAFLSADENTFTLTNVILWIGALVSLLLALWDGDLRPSSAWKRAVEWLRRPRLHIRIEAWGLTLLLVFLVAAWYRFARLEAVPVEMVSDHAEKLLDVMDVEAGQTSIFFPRNTGREALQFYLAVATDRLLGTGITHLTLKIGMVVAGFLTLPFLYLFAKELGGRNVGLAALFLGGVAYWPNVVSRVGLRFPLYPLFVAPAMYYLARGLRRRRRNDLLLCGLVVGLGLHGYSPARAIPLVVALGVGLFLLHKQAVGRRREALVWLVAAGTVALVAVLPLARVAAEAPDLVLYRTLTRVAATERELPGPAVGIFFSNLWNALRMFAWDNGEIWVIGLPGRPALDVVAGALFHLGVVITLVRYVRTRNWIDLFTLASIPVLLLPSVLALAFPSENPALNRAGGAIIPVFALAGVALAAVPAWLRGLGAGRRARMWGVGACLMLALLSSLLNYRLVFVQYADLFLRSAWNTSDLGRVVRGFAESVGRSENAYVIGYPHWVDTRLVGINAGDPARDYAIDPATLGDLAEVPEPQLFLLNPQDEESLETLRRVFPEGRLTRFLSEQEGHDFLIFFVPGQGGAYPSMEEP